MKILLLVPKRGRYLTGLGGLIAADEEEEKLGSKVYAPNKSPSSVHSELDASLIIAILTLHTKGRIALNYICWTVHSR